MIADTGGLKMMAYRKKNANAREDNIRWWGYLKNEDQVTDSMKIVDWD